MAVRCDEISLMLGPFEDGELEPHEMQEVARHLAACPACEGQLRDYNLIGRELRVGLAHEPSLEGFAQAVQVRIRRVKRPLGMRVAWLLERTAERMRAPIALGSLAAVAAVFTVLVVTPYVRHLMHRQLAVSPAVATIAAKTAPQPQRLVASASLLNPGQNSRAVISRLETETPSVAMWTDPRNDTTVIWLPEGKQ